MKPETRSNILLGATRSKGKMFEYNIPTEDHISLPKDPARLFLLSLGILGDFAELVIEGNAVTIDAADRSNLLFAAQFLEAFYLSRLEPEYDAYLESLISATYYICDLPVKFPKITREF